MQCPKCKSENHCKANYCNECGCPLKFKSSVNDRSKNPKAYTPKFLAEKILTSKTTIEGERKHVSVMFADVANYTSLSEKLDPEIVHQIMDGAFKILLEQTHGHQGTINQFTGDGVMALFGAPLALENHAQNACQAALAIKREMEIYSQQLNINFNINFKIRIGINSGTVVIGSIGDDLRMDYTAIGDTTNLAARMESMADPGKIFISYQTYKLVPNLFEFKQIGEKKVKGKSKPIVVHELIKERVNRLRLGGERNINSILVGRNKEISMLEIQLNKAILGQGSVINIIGEAGIGKSRLVNELKQKYSLKRISILEGHSISIGQNLSFHPIIELFRQLAGIRESDSEAKAINKLANSIRAIDSIDADEILPFVATLMGMKLTGAYAKRIGNIEGEALENLIIKNIRMLLIKMCSSCPIVIIMDDLHWADKSSLELLKTLYRLTVNYGIVFINLFRPGYFKEKNDLIINIANDLVYDYVEINLKPLEKQDSEAMVSNMLNFGGLPSNFLNEICQRTEGNPFFIEEVIRSLIEDGTITKTDAGYRTTEKLKKVTIPSTINDVLIARIDRLEESTRELIRIASVIGKNFFDSLIRDVAASIQDIDFELEYLKNVQLISDRIRMQELEYSFKHPLVQEVVYNSILMQKRKELHLRVASSIEKIYNEKLHEFYGVLSYHYSRGENLHIAEKYLLKSGEEALKSSASYEAIYYYKQAMELYIGNNKNSLDQIKVAEFERHIATSFLNNSYFDEAVEYYDRSRVRLGEKIIQGKVKLYLSILANLIKFRFCLRYITKRHLILPDKKIIKALEERINVARALIFVDAHRCFSESIGLVLFALRYDLSKSQTIFDVISGGSALFSITGISLDISQKLITYLRNNLSIKEKIKISTFQLDVFETMHNSLSGKWNQDIDPEIINYGQSIGDIYMTSGYLLWTGYMKIETGEFDIVKTIINNLNEIVSLYEHEHAIADFNYLNARWHLKMAKPNQAIEFAEKCALRTGSIGWEGRKIQSLGIKTRIYALLLNFQAANKAIKEADEMISLIGTKAILPFCYIDHLIGKITLKLLIFEKEVEEKGIYGANEIRYDLKLTIKKLKKVFRYVAFERVEALRLIGTFCWLDNKKQNAIQWWEKSIKEGENIGSKIEIAKTYFEIGKRLISQTHETILMDKSEAYRYLTKAKKLFENLDMEKYLIEIETF